MTEESVPSPSGTPTPKPALKHRYEETVASPAGTPTSYLDPPVSTRSPPPTGELFTKLAQTQTTPIQLTIQHPKPSERAELKIIPNTFLIIVDTYDWAWDIASKELLKAMPKNKGIIIDIADMDKVDPRQFNVVLIYPWGATGLTEQLDLRNTVICVAGGEQLEHLDLLKAKCGRFKYFGACNERIQARLMMEFPDKTILHLTHGVNHRLFKPPKKQPKEFTIGWVGNASRTIKRYPLAVKIAEQGGFKLDVAGFKRYSHSEMVRYYQSIHTLLVTSYYEAHPLVVYEAMSTGLPVVTTNVGDVSRYIVNGENGFILSRSANPTDYIKILNRLKKNEKLRMRIGKAARQTVIENLSWGKIVQQYTPLTKLMGVK